jgi:hypothetical protein
MTSKYKPTEFIIYEPIGDVNKQIYITRSGAFIKFVYIKGSVEKVVKKIKAIANYFTLTSKNIMGDVNYFKCYTMNKANHRMIVPRFGIFEILDSKHGLSNYRCVSQITPGEPPSTPFVWQGRQTENQIVITDTIMREYYTPERVACGSAGVIVDLDAGQGKSFVAAYMISKIQQKTAIILHSTALVAQWAKVLRTALGPNVSIGYYYAKQKIEGDIMIMIVDSASHEEFKLNGEVLSAIEYYKRFGFFIYDECHLYSNKKAMRALKYAQGQYMMGLSATTNEHTLGYDRAVWWNIGPVLDTRSIPNFVSTSEDFKALVHKISYYGPDKHTRLIINERTDMISSQQTINMICEDEARNKLVIQCVKDGLALGLFIFVFADRREYLLKLRNMLAMGEIMTDDKDFVRIVGGAEADALERAELESRVIFTTYQYMGTGKSVVKMTGLVLATPRRSKMKQYINRIFRLGSDMSVKRHIWDIVDVKIPVRTQWNTRRKHYVAKGYDIELTEVDYKDIPSLTGDIVEFNAGSDSDADNTELNIDALDSTITESPFQTTEDDIIIIDNLINRLHS